MTAIKDIQVYVSYPDFVYQNEFRGIFKYYDEVINLLDVYLTCPKMQRWCENFLHTTVIYYNLEFTIERTFQSDTKSTYRYIQRDKNKEIVIDMENISKEEILEKVKNFFKENNEPSSETKKFQ